MLANVKLKKYKKFKKKFFNKTLKFLLRLSSARNK